MAILIVTAYRFLRDIPTAHWSGRWLAELIHFGDRGVDLFFVLSGFLITGILLQSRQQPHYFRNFLARRTLRIFPLYFASLAVFLFVIPWLWSDHPFQQAIDQQFYLWTYLGNMRCAWLDQWCFGSLDHFWSLAVEEHFYLLWPLCVFVLGVRRTILFAALTAMLCAAARILFAMLSDNGVAPDVASGFRFDGLLLGGAIAGLSHHSRGLSNWRTAALLIFMLTLPSCIYLELRHDRLLTISHSGWAMLWGSGLVLLLTTDKESYLAKFFRGRGLRFLGKYSYGMYIIQSPLIPLLAGVWSAAGLRTWLGSGTLAGISASLLYATVMFAISVLLAMLSWNVLERHCLKLKRWFP